MHTKVFKLIVVFARSWSGQEVQLYHARKMLGFARKMLGFARKMLGFARKFFLDLCSRSLGDRSKFSYDRNARPFIRLRSLGSKIQNQKLCSRSLGLGVGPSQNFQLRAEPSQNFTSQKRAELFSSLKSSSRARAEPRARNSKNFPKLSMNF